MRRPESEDAVGPDEVDYGAVGLALAPGIPYERWEAIGRALWAMEWGRLWWLGDWLAYGERVYGERAAQAEALDGYDYATLSGARWVCGRIAADRRHAELSFAHHREVAVLTPAEQERWLAAAAREGWSVQELRAVLRAAPTPFGRPAPRVGARERGGARRLPRGGLLAGRMRGTDRCAGALLHRDPSRGTAIARMPASDGGRMHHGADTGVGAAWS